MNRNAPTLYVSYEFKKNLGNWESETATVGVSGLPFDADDSTIQTALDTGERTLEAIRVKLRKEIAVIRREIDHKAFEPAIPADAELPDPHEGWDMEPITDGQLVALNAGLSSMKITGDSRFNACQYVTGIEISSTKDLSRLDAHKVLDWISNATPDDVALITKFSTGQEVLI